MQTDHQQPPPIPPTPRLEVLDAEAFDAIMSDFISAFKQRIIAAIIDTLDQHPLTTGQRRRIEDIVTEAVLSMDLPAIALQAGIESNAVTDTPAR